MRQNNRKPEPTYRVNWVGKDPNLMFSKAFIDGNEAKKLADSNADSIAYKIEKKGQDSIQYKIIPSAGSKEMVRDLKLKRQMREKKGMNAFINADGIGSVETVSTSEYKYNQNSKLISTVAISGALIYAGTRKEIENKYIRWSFIGLGVIHAIFNLKNYSINKNA
jgi:hypothetical protein